MLQFCLLGSGSSGNALLVLSEQTKILIDNGLSYKQLEARARLVGQGLEDLSAVFVTHEHGDHVKGLGVLCRKRPIPVFMTEQTRENLPRSLGPLPHVAAYEAGETIVWQDMELGSFSVSHDAIDPVSYVVRSQGAQLGLATDLGHLSNLVRTRLSGSHALIVEANYCPDRLRVGPYPPQIQQRIRSRLGHLSNQDMCSLLSDLQHELLQLVVLVHISENNNHPELVTRMARQALRNDGVGLHVAAQDAPTPMMRVCEAPTHTATAYEPG